MSSFICVLISVKQKPPEEKLRKVKLQKYFNYFLLKLKLTQSLQRN